MRIWSGCRSSGFYADPLRVFCFPACWVRILRRFPDAIGADLVRVFRSAGLFLFPVPDVMQVVRILCAFPLTFSGSIALHCIIVLVAYSKILRFKRIRLLYIHFRVYAFKMYSGRVLCGSRAFRAVPVPVLRVMVGLHSIICRFKRV